MSGSGAVPFCGVAGHALDRGEAFVLVPVSKHVYGVDAPWHYDPNSPAKIVCCVLCLGTLEGAEQHLPDNIVLGEN